MQSGEPFIQPTTGGSTEGVLLWALDHEVLEAGSLSFLTFIPALQNVAGSQDHVASGAAGLILALPLPGSDLGKPLTFSVPQCLICKMGI